MSDAVLSLEGNLSNISLQADASPDRLLQGRFRGAEPRIEVDGASVRIRVQGSLVVLLLTLLGRRAKPVGKLTLNASRPWQIQLHGRVVNVNADLRDVDLRSLEIVGGVDGVTVDLPRPTGGVRVGVHGGVSRVTFRRPADVPLALTVRGGMTGLKIDEEELQPRGGSYRWQSPDFDPIGDAYLLDVSGGISGLTVSGS